MAPFTAAPEPSASYFRDQLLDRRARLAARPDLRGRQDFHALLREVDAALARLDDGSYGACEACHDPIESGRLVGNPLTRVCLGCLSDAQQRELERDLESAASVQRALLPDEHVQVGGWEIEHRSHPLGPVSGDYCDVLPSAVPGGPIHFILGDVAGKGVSASLVTAHIQALFRTLASPDLPLAVLAERANRILCEATVASSFSTLVLGRLSTDGTLELCNAGHNPPLLIRRGEIEHLAATGIPLGVFRESTYQVVRFRLGRGDTLFLYTDGLSEATDGNGEQYGAARVEAMAGRLNGEATGTALESFLGDLDRFRRGAPREDDLMVMMIRRSE